VHTPNQCARLALQGSVAELAYASSLDNTTRIYGPYTRKDGRMHIIVYKNGKRKTVSYPKYLLEKKLGRTLLANETCDHIDGDFTNNSLSNLQVLTRGDNIRKHAALQPLELGTFTCPVCNCSFTKPMHQVRHNRKQSKTGPYCGKSCAGKSSKNLSK